MDRLATSSQRQLLSAFSHALRMLLAMMACGCGGPDASVQDTADTRKNGGSMSPEQWLSRGNDLRKTDKLKSVDAYSQAIRLDSSFDVAYYNRALTLSELGRDEEAAADLETLVQRNSEFAPRLKELFAAISGAFISVGNDAFESGDYELALNKYRAAAMYNAENAGGHIGCGLVYAQKGQRDDALAAFTRAIEVDPESSIAYQNRGELFLAEQEFGTAIDDLSRAIEWEPDEPSIYTSRARAYEARGESDKAQQDRNAAAQLAAQP
jgi:tetratricopeptide (TPR) repeat protein